MHKNDFTLPKSFTGSYTEDEPNLPWESNLVLQKKVVWRRQGCEFQGIWIGIPRAKSVKSEVMLADHR